MKYNICRRHVFSYTYENLTHPVEHVNNRLSIILHWCRYNKLSINPTKSECMSAVMNNCHVCHLNCLGYQVLHTDSINTLVLELLKTIIIHEHAYSVVTYGVAQKVWTHFKRL